MDERIRYRIEDIADAIAQIELLVDAANFVDFSSDRVKRAAFERFLEIISEASRHIPDTYKTEHSHIPWRRIADIGNHLRHAYQRIDAQILWDIYASGELLALRAAIDQMLADG
jgi:uncharacterized protein with HEPN domain